MPLVYASRWPACLLALACAAATAACAATATSATSAAPRPAGTPAAPAASPAAPATSPATPLERLHAMTAAGQCATDADCRTLPVGARACGGPEGYLPYSTRGTDVPALRALADQLAAERRAEIARTGEQGTCMIQPDPGAACRAQRCVLRRPGLQ